MCACTLACTCVAYTRIDLKSWPFCSSYDSNTAVVPILLHNAHYRDLHLEHINLHLLTHTHARPHMHEKGHEQNARRPSFDEADVQIHSSYPRLDPSIHNSKTPTTDCELGVRLVVACCYQPNLMNSSVQKITVPLQALGLKPYW